MIRFGLANRRQKSPRLRPPKPIKRPQIAMPATILATPAACAEQITKAGGFVAKYMGDGVLAYFGYPQAHEHDAERAVRSGLALIDAVPKLTTAASAPLQVRVGIATGLVVVGDLIGAGAAQEQAVVGKTPNLAARLQALAEPGAVVISSSTRRLTGGLFDYAISGQSRSKASPRPSRHGRRWARAPPRSGSRRCARARRRLSGAARRSICSCAAGSRRRAARARSSCSRASQASASHESPRPSSSA
jgi:hypothetical protein